MLCAPSCYCPLILPNVSSVLLPLALEGGRYALRHCAGAGAFVPDLPLAFEPFLYCTPSHLALQRHTGVSLGFYLEDQRQAKIVATYQLMVEAETQMGYSPWQAPFGAVQMALGVSAVVMQAFLEGIHQLLKEYGVQRLRVRSYPFAYDPSGSALLTQVFLQLGYQITLAELNKHLPVTETGFEAALHVSERRRLYKCRSQGFHFQQEPIQLLPAAYEFLHQCRTEKGQHLSLSFERLQELFQQFPQNHFLFSVRDGAGQWAALTIAIQVNKQVLYNFYPASPLRYNGFSPVVMLNEGLYAFSLARGIKVLDLGTSTLPEGPNYSLLQFKRHLGGVPSLKLTFEHNL